MKVSNFWKKFFFFNFLFLKVDDFDPMIEVDDKLLVELNKNGDLRNFIISVRALFVKNYQ